MNAHRRYYFLHEGNYPEGAHDKIRDILKHHCETRWWYNDPLVEGQPFDKLSFSFTVTGGEQWEAHQRAMRLAVDCYELALGFPPARIPEPMWETLAPHTNRGRYRTPR